MSTSGGYRGLQNFINEIRQCKSKEAEGARISKELANIRTKFKGDRNLSSYEKKKYIWCVAVEQPPPPTLFFSSSRVLFSLSPARPPRWLRACG